MKFTDEEQQRYIAAYAKIFDLKEAEVREYANKKGLIALIKNPEELLKREESKEQYEAFVKLYHMTQHLTMQKEKLNSPEAVAAFAQSVMTDIYKRESFVAIFLDAKLRPITYEEISIGSLDSTMANPREIFGSALRNNASSIILCHNHPSGDVTPSSEDVGLTAHLKTVGEYMQIPILDHVIVDGLNPQRAYSFREDDRFVFTEPDLYVRDGAREKQAERKSLDDFIHEIKTKSVVSQTKEALEKRKNEPIR